MDSGDSLGEKYIVLKRRRGLLRSWFAVYGDSGGLVASWRKPAFTLKEHYRLFAGADSSEELLMVRARRRLSIGQLYDFVLPGGDRVGSLRWRPRTGRLDRESWTVFDQDENEVAVVREAVPEGLSMLRLYLSYCVPPRRYEVVRDSDGARIGEIRRRSVLAPFRLGVVVLADDPLLDDLVLLGTACMIGAVGFRRFMHNTE